VDISNSAQNSSAIGDLTLDSTMKSPSSGDGDYVWDVFYHRPATLTEWNEIANVGTLLVHLASPPVALLRSYFIELAFQLSIPSHIHLTQTNRRKRTRRMRTPMVCLGLTLLIAPEPTSQTRNTTRTIIQRMRRKRAVVCPFLVLSWRW